MTQLADAVARGRVAEDLSATLFVEAGAGSGKTRSLVDRVVALVEAGVAMRSIVAITFTEKAAAELRARIRLALEGRRERADEWTRELWQRALDDVDGAAVSTLHAFAQRILTEHPLEAGLPPNVEVLDEVASQIEFEERWRPFREALLDDGRMRRTLLLAFATGVKLEHLRQLAVAFEDDWDLVEERLPDAVPEPPPLPVAALLNELAEIVADGAGCRNAGDRLLERLGKLADYGERLRDAADEYEQVQLLADAPSCKVGNCGQRRNWGDINAVRDRVAAFGERLESLRARIADAALHRIAVEIRRFVLRSAQERRDAGRLVFHDLLVLARRLLRGEHGVEVRAALAQRYQRLLLDEFQDTDPIQIELAVLLASRDADAGDKDWRDVPVEPGRLFFVGDPKQSIYRFRRADIGLYLSAAEVFGDDLLRLSTNFRTVPSVIDWVNRVFGELLQFEAGSQPAYAALTPPPEHNDPPGGPTVALLGRETHVDKLTADELRDREAAEVADAVLTAIGEGWPVRQRPDTADGPCWRPATFADVTVLLPARTSLAALERAFEARAIPYRAETSSLVYSTPEVRDLFAVLRAVADPTDQLSLVTALRSPVFGCGDDDLATYRLVHCGSWSYLAAPPESMPADHPVADAFTTLADWHAAVPWMTPSELLERIARERRLFELGFASGRPRDLWRRLRFVIDQARAWSEAEGGTLRAYLEWARLQASESARVAETVLPETDDESVRILTIHGAKGLEFPITILSGMSTAPRQASAGAQVVWPPDGSYGLKIGSAVVTREYADFAPVDERMSHHERLRLLYVACTRARDHLVVSLHRKERKASPDSPAKLTNAELLASATESAHAAARIQRLSTAPLKPYVRQPSFRPPLPAFEDWRQELESAIDAAARPRTVGATGVARLLVSDVEQDPGLDKDPLDLDLPPWVKGRYGTAIGRAVHAVLQTVDLATGAGLDDAVAAQAAAEAVIGREDEIRALAAAALTAPSVQAALAYPRWRETYVAARVGEMLLEGYIDLMYRSGDGLVVVDYKTAGSDRDLDRRVAAYRLQAGAYALALQTAVGEPVARVVFVFLTPSGARERALPDVDAAIEEVRERLAATVGAC